MPESLSAGFGTDTFFLDGMFSSLRRRRSSGMSFTEMAMCDTIWKFLNLKHTDDDVVVKGVYLPNQCDQMSIVLFQYLAI